jgi:hypothetical protein
MASVERHGAYSRYVAARARVESTPVGDADTRPLERGDIVPGMRCVDGVWLYSAAWL